MLESYPISFSLETICGIIKCIKAQAHWLARSGSLDRQLGERGDAMHDLTFITILLCILVAAAISRRIQGTILTLPMVYTLLGLLGGRLLLDFIRIGPDSEVVRLLAEVALVLVLASDASRISLRSLARDHNLPMRLLLIGLPLTMVLGTLVAAGMFNTLGFWGAAILGVLLSPTDATLGQAVVSNPKVPARIRQTLNIESGMNDGLAMPFLLLAIAMAVATENLEFGIAPFLGHAALTIVLGVLAGGLVAVLGVLFVELGHSRGWMSEKFEKISLLALIFLAYAVAELVGGNGFVAAFCFGIVSGNRINPEVGGTLYEHVEVEISLLLLLTFLIFGAVLLPPALTALTPMMALYAFISLTLVRMVPVAISLIGSRVRPVTTLFLGWFGPRGIASILYIYIVLDAEGLEVKSTIYSVTMITVFFSIFAHGATAVPLANWYGKLMADRGIVQPDAAEHFEVTELPLRSKPRTR